MFGWHCLVDPLALRIRYYVSIFFYGCVMVAFAVWNRGWFGRSLRSSLFALMDFMIVREEKLCSLHETNILCYLVCRCILFCCKFYFSLFPLFLSSHHNWLGCVTVCVRVRVRARVFTRLSLLAFICAN